MIRKFMLAAILCASPLSPSLGEPASDVVADHNAAYAAGDYSAFIDTFAEDAIVVVDGIEFRGRDAIAANYALNFGPDAPQVQIKRQGRLAGGGVVQEEAYVLPNGAQMCCSVSAFRVRDGQIVRVDIDSSGMGLGG